MIYQCINFYNELDLLDLQLHELNDVVDKVVLVEATRTFTNQPKPLIFQQNKKRFRKFLHKINHVIVRDSPNVSMPWIIEHHQFAAVARGLQSAKNNDTILLCCTDELPKRERIVESKNSSGKHRAFHQVVCQGYLNVQATGKESRLPCSRMFTYEDLRTYTDPYIARFSPIDRLIEDGGWHFTFMGDVKRIQKKLAAFSHQEFNNDRFNTAEYIQRVFRQGRDILGTEKRFVKVSHSLLPRYVQEQPEKFRNLLFEGELREDSVLYLLSHTKQSARLIYRALRRLAS